MAELNFNNVMIGSAQPQVLGEFYAQVFDRPADMNEDGWYGWHVGAAWLSIGEHSEVKERAQEPQRLIMNFETKDVKEEAKRLQAAGATMVKGRGRQRSRGHGEHARHPDRLRPRRELFPAHDAVEGRRGLLRRRAAFSSV